MKKKILTLFGLISFMLLLIPNTYALELTEAGETVNQDGEYDSVRLIAGNSVSSTAKINGISFVAGNTVNVKGNTQYGFYAGNVLTINESVEKDAFVAGNSITIGSDAVIGRDLFVAGQTVIINGSITRNIYAGGDTVNISGITINGDAYIDADKIIMDNDTVITGKFTHLENAKITGMNKDNIGEIKTHKNTSIKIEYDFKAHLYSLIYSIIGAFVVMIALFYIMPKTREKLEDVKLEFSTIAKTIGAGALVVLIIPITVLLALFTGVLAPLSLIVLAIYFIGLYLASLLTAYVVGNILGKKVFKNNSVYLALIVGIIIIKLVKYIPFIGGLLIAACLSYGMGLMYKYIVSIRKQ